MSVEELKSRDVIRYFGSFYFVRKNSLKNKVICLIGISGQRCIRHIDFNPEKAVKP
jgi:hypothetical protein